MKKYAKTYERLRFFSPRFFPASPIIFHVIFFNNIIDQIPVRVVLLLNINIFLFFFLKFWCVKRGKTNVRLYWSKLSSTIASTSVSLSL